MVEKGINVEEDIETYIDLQSEPKRSDLQALHQLVLQVLPTGRLWFEDGRNGEGKVVANPSIGYGSYIIQYADGSTREFYQIGLSANKTGISVYILGLKDKSFLAKTFGKAIGKASVTGYCIKFKSLKEIDVNVLEAAMRYRIEIQSEES